ncbi:MAG: OmpA family protein [Burkholderiales bacterium]|nr:OmpA family protein [Burkholderiales bacterium]
MNTTRLLSLLALAVLAGACVDGGMRRPGMLPPYAAPDRVTDEAMRADLASMETLQQRLALLNRGGTVPTSNYHWAKAQCWLDMARHNYHENDRSGTVESALAQSEGLIKGLEAGATPSSETRLIDQSVRIRDDLWERTAGYKRHAQFMCVAPQVACLEVQLVWMGQEYKEGGWRHANPYIGIAEGMAARVERDLAACVPPPQPVAPVAAPKPAPAPAPAPVAERFTLSADALFGFDKSGRDDLLPEGRRRLDEFVARVKQLARIDRITLTGYADRLGARERNARLALDRAATVKAYLVAAGIPERVVQVDGRGSANPVVVCADGPPAKLRECLQPNRRVEVDLAGAILR